MKTIFLNLYLEKMNNKLCFQLPSNFAYMNSRKNAGSNVFSVNQMENEKTMINQGLRKKLCTVNYDF